MKRKAIKFLILFLLIAGVTVLLNTEVTYQQGVNFEVSSVKIPLYLKILGFFDRHYNYKNLVSKIIKESDNPEERVMKLFNWTYNNIRRVPKGYPVIDDHVWHIIVRGYGTDDQSADVFTTLCNYAGVDAFFDFMYARGDPKVMPFSFVRLDKKWKLFDVYNGVYFVNKSGDLASMDEIQKGEWKVSGISEKESRDVFYAGFVERLPSLTNIGLKRANIQSPLKRLLFEVVKWVKK